MSIGPKTTRRGALRGSLALAALALARPALADDAAGRAAEDLWGHLRLVDRDGATFTLASLARPVTIVNMWASWCTACLREVPEVARAQSMVGPDKVEVILVSHPHWWAEDLAAADRRRIALRQAHPDGEYDRATIEAALTDGSGFYQVPRSLVFARSPGGPRLAYAGRARWDSPSSLAMLSGLAARASA